MTPFVDVSDRTRSTALDFWPPIVITKEDIEAEIERLAAMPRSHTGRRESLIVHPRSGDSLALAPGIQVRLCVLRPGETTSPIRHNSTQLSFCIYGAGHACVENHRISFEQYDVWNQPGYRTYWHENDTRDLQVRLEYSNAPVLESLNVHLVDEQPPKTWQTDPKASADIAGEVAEASPFGTFPLTNDNAWLMPYELLINPPPVESVPLSWAWREVKRHLDALSELGDRYRGRRLYLLYNPATGRTNGTTPAFFATMTIRPPGIVDRPHRHVSAAINYYFHGTGRSVVDGRKYTWKAGDLMLSAPGWATHHHASDDTSHVHELTVQDQPFHIAIESLLWQENLRQPPRVLGAQAGFATNRATTSQ